MIGGSLPRDQLTGMIDIYDPQIAGQSKVYSLWIDDPIVGQWTDVTLNVTGQFKRKDGADAVMAAGDAIDDIFFSAGQPNDTDLTMLIDDVVLIGRD